jgi:hypothetical protein
VKRFYGEHRDVEGKKEEKKRNGGERGGLCTKGKRREMGGGGGGGLVTVGGYGLNASFHVNVMVLMWSLSGEIGMRVSTRQRALKYFCKRSRREVGVEWG